MKTFAVVSMILVSSSTMGDNNFNNSKDRDAQGLPSLGTTEIVHSPLGIGAFRFHYDLSDKALFLSTEPTVYHLMNSKVTGTVKIRKKGLVIEFKF